MIHTFLNIFDSLNQQRNEMNVEIISLLADFLEIDCLATPDPMLFGEMLDILILEFNFPSIRQSWETYHHPIKSYEDLCTILQLVSLNWFHDAKHAFLQKQKSIDLSRPCQTVCQTVCQVKDYPLLPIILPPYWISDVSGLIREYAQY